MTNIENNEKATYKGYTAIKYGKSSLVVKDTDGKCVFHTGKRNEKYCKDLHQWLVDYIDNFKPMLEKHWKELYNSEDEEDI